MTRWTLDDYVRGVTGRGPRIAAADVGRPRGGPRCDNCDRPGTEDNPLAAVGPSAAYPEGLLHAYGCED